MPFEQVAEVIRKSYGYEWNEVFQSIDVHPLGSASIAQVHRAVLKTGGRCCRQSSEAGYL